MSFHLSKIPPRLHHLVALTEKYRIADDLAREKLFINSSIEEQRTMKEAVERCDVDFDVWLAGPEAAGPEYSDEYIAFSALRMAADFA